MDGDLWIVGTHLHAQVAVAPLDLERVTDERWQSLQLSRPLGGNPEAISAVEIETICFGEMSMSWTSVGGTELISVVAAK